MINRSAAILKFYGFSKHASKKGSCNHSVILMKEKQITIMGVGNILFTDEGVGVRVLEMLTEQYDFPTNVAIVDGGVLGMNLLGDNFGSGSPDCHRCGSK